MGNSIFSYTHTYQDCYYIIGLNVKIVYNFRPIYFCVYRDVPILASLLLTLGFVSCHFVIPMNCCLLNFVSYAPYTDSPSVQGIHFTSCQNMYTVN